MDNNNKRKMLAVDLEIHRRLKIQAAINNLKVKEAANLFLDEILSQKENEQTELQTQAA